MEREKNLFSQLPLSYTTAIGYFHVLNVCELKYLIQLKGQKLMQIP